MTDSKDTISVIIPCYNNSRTLRRAVLAALASTWKDKEIVVVDDGSNDSPESMIDDLIDNHRVKFCRKVNGGLGSARDTGVNNSTGRYISFLDADDEIGPDKLEKQWRTIQESGPETIAFTGTRAVYDDGSVKIKNHFSGKKEFLNITREMISGSVRPSGPSMFMERNLYDRIGGFWTEIRRQTEFEFLCRAIGEGVRFFMVNRPLYVQYMSSASNRFQSSYRVDSLQKIFARFDAMYNGLRHGEEQKRNLRSYIEHKALMLSYTALTYNAEARTEMLWVFRNSTSISGSSKLFLRLIRMLPPAFRRNSTSEILKKIFHLRFLGR